MHRRIGLCDSVLSKWDRTFKALEDRIDLTLDESKRPAGDKPFFKLLKQAKNQKYLYLLALERASYHWNSDELKQGGLSADESEKAKNAVERFGTTSSNCHARVRVDIQYGSYSARDDNCSNVARESYTAPVSPKPLYTGKEAEARSWKTQHGCEGDGFVWIDGVCHAKSKE